MPNKFRATGRRAIEALPPNASGQIVYKLELPSRPPIYLGWRDLVAIRRALAELDETAPGAVPAGGDRVAAIGNRFNYRPAPGGGNDAA